ncbi:MAG: hypothetical protein IOMNBAOH_02799 [Rhodocyclaceae bacterium]|nr:hypothetical protein [Rhodocyclaceae bacterium]
MRTDPPGRTPRCSPLPDRERCKNFQTTINMTANTIHLIIVPACYRNGPGLS